MHQCCGSMQAFATKQTHFLETALSGKPNKTHINTTLSTFKCRNVLHKCKQNGCRLIIKIHL